MNSTLQIVLTLLDEASAQMAGIGSSVTANLQDIQSQANQVRNTFGLMGAAILGGLGVLVDQAANVDTAQSQLNTAVTAGVDAANQGASATSALAKEKAYLPQVNLAKFRPWLQDFNMGADYTSAMVQDEIRATEDSLGADYAGFMLWNPSNIYTQDAVLKK